MRVLCFHLGHDRGACLIQDGKIIVSISEERLDRIKHSRGSEIPYLSIQYCLNHGRCKGAELDLIVFGYAKTEEKDLGQKVRSKLRERWQIPEEKVKFVTHHLAHLYSAFYLSPFKEAAVLIIDGAGNKNDGEPRDYLQQFTQDPEAIEAESGYYVNTSMVEVLWKRWQRRQGLRTGRICGDQISLGRLYWEACLFVGLGFFDGGKLMGMAPYGEDVYRDIEIVKKRDGTLYVNDRWKEHFKTPQTFKERANIAYKIQKELQEAIIYLANRLYEQTRCDNLCMAGGVALNSVTNYLVLQRTPFKNLFVPPCTNDTGIPIGCAFYGHHKFLRGQTRNTLINAYLGRSYSKEEIKQAILRNSQVLSARYYDDEQLVQNVAKLIAKRKIIGWFRGGSEIGPRALGHRSILCDARSPKMKDILNFKVKHREWYRPFAPSVLLEHAEEYFTIDRASPYMLLIADVKEDKRKIIPAVTHIDGTARLQTVTKKDNGIYYELIKKFYELTGVPVILNTSFNLAGEPIVEAPDDAIKCFLNTQMDYLVLENWLLQKKFWSPQASWQRLRIWFDNILGRKTRNFYKEFRKSAVSLMERFGVYELYKKVKVGIKHIPKIIANVIPKRKYNWDVITAERAIPGEMPRHYMISIKKRTKFAMGFMHQDSMVLDAGCGVGWSSSKFAKRAKKVFGVDYSEEAIEYAKKEYQRENLNFIVMNVCDLQFDDNFFDIVISFEVLEHLTLDQAKECVAETYRVLKPGGLLIGTTPIVPGETGRDQCEIKHHVHEYSQKELHELLSNYFAKIEYPRKATFICTK
jgi:carbamoyltransferase